MDETAATTLAPVDTRLWALAHTLGMVVRPLMLRQKNTWLGPIPETGPVLMLGNHAAFLDPVVLALGTSRPVHFMASEQLFRTPRVGALVSRLGAFPKAKYARDPASIDRVVALHAAGRVIGLFPEGNRSWDGRPAPILPGLGWLIKKLGGPVVFVRNFTGWMMQPRWAHHMRSVPMDVEYSAPFTFPEDWSTARIEEEVTARITIVPSEVKLRGWSWGRRLAKGLPDYLWACPACFARGALTVPDADPDTVRCSRCPAGWRVDVSQGLTPLSGGAEPGALTVASAFDTISAHFGELPTMDADRFVADGVALEDPAAKVSRVTDTGLTPLAEGPVTLFADRLKVGDSWEMPLDDIKAVSMELGNMLQFRTTNELFELSTPNPLCWNHFLSRHVGRSRPVRRGRKR